MLMLLLLLLLVLLPWVLPLRVLLLVLYVNVSAQLFAVASGSIGACKAIPILCDALRRRCGQGDLPGTVGRRGRSWR